MFFESPFMNAVLKFFILILNVDVTFLASLYNIKQQTGIFNARIKEEGIYETVVSHLLCVPCSG